MNVTYEKKDAMTFIGFHTEIRPEEGYQKCPEFWDKEYNIRYAQLWQTMQPQTPVEAAILANGIGMFAICAESENGFDYWIAGLYRGGELPEGLELYTFPASSWAVFTTKGVMPESLQTLNTWVWQEWFPTEGKKCRKEMKSIRKTAGRQLTFTKTKKKSRTNSSALRKTLRRS